MEERPDLLPDYREETLLHTPPNLLSEKTDGPLLLKLCLLFHSKVGRSQISFPRLHLLLDQLRPLRWFRLSGKGSLSLTCVPQLAVPCRERLTMENSLSYKRSQASA